MPVKILKCSCNKDYFFQTEVSVVRHLVNFHCECEDMNHEIFVLFCRSHPFGSTILNVVVNPDRAIETKCFCKKKGSNELCQMA